MPAVLPPTSAYTYCVDLSADEAGAVGATSVRFDKPVWFYVENFIDFPTGIQVPIGFYDSVKGEWVASDSGLVIKIVSISAGAADLDVTGDGAADSGPALDALGITDAERQQLAARYAAGQSLWRAPIPHFSTVDANWPGGSNPAGSPNGGEPTQPKPVDKPDDPPNVYIQNQTLGEQIAITGTPFTLNYRSNRVRGYRSAYELRIPLSGPSLIGAVQRIDLEVIVAGRSFRQQFAPAPNLIAGFEWDGLDAYGRVVAGAQPVTVRISNIYRGAYRGTRRFGYLGEFELAGNLLRAETAVTASYTRRLGNFDIRPQSLGGWTFDVHHSYDPLGRVLYQGDGTTRSVENVNGIITTVAGTGSAGFSGDGGPATAARINQPWGVAVLADGSLLIAETLNHRIRRVDPSGIISTFAGTGVAGFAGDGGPATAAQLSFPTRAQLAPDGSIYIDDKDNVRIRRILPNGIITTAAGTGQVGNTGDDGPAPLARLGGDPDPFPASDGTVYLSDIGNNRIRRIGADGIISAVAGTGAQGFSGDGGSALLATFRFPVDLIPTRDGFLFVGDLGNNRIRRIGPDGIITMAAGGGANSTSEDVPALQANLNFATGVDLAPAPDGGVYFSERQRRRIRHLRANGTIKTVAGPGVPGILGDGGPALQGALQNPFGLGVGPDGSLYIGDAAAHRVRRVAPPLPGFTAEDIALASEDGTQLSRFDANGRHLETRDAFTGAVLFTFGYDADGQLARITDASGNVTAIERTAAGAPTAIVAPFGQRTVLSADANGSLASIASPAGKTSTFVSREDGLLTSATDPNGTARIFTYDARGRLTAFDPPGANRFELTRAETEDGYLISTNTALGRQETYTVEALADGGEKRTRTEPGGEFTLQTKSAAGIETTVRPNGLSLTETLGADPRFGFAAPLGKSLTVATPGGKAVAIQRTRTAALANASDPLSLTGWTETITRNGRPSATTYDAATKSFDSASSAGRHVVETINDRGQTVREQVGDLAPAAFTYDARGRAATIADGEGAATRTGLFTYGASGFLTSRTDALGRVTQFTRDADGRATRLVEPGGRTLDLTRDGLGDLTRLAIVGGATHLLTHTDFGKLASYTAPDAGSGPAVTSFTYDADEHLTRITRPGGQTIDFSYDAAGRQIARTVAAGATTFTHSPTSGLVTTVTAPGGSTLSFAYDGPFQLGRTWTGAVAGSVTETIDNDLRPASQSVNGGSTVSFTYDADSLVTGIGALAFTRSAASGLIVGASIGGLSEAFGHNEFGEQTSHTASFGGAALWAQQLAYDKLGRLTQRDETIAGATDVFAYSYDAAGRLSEVRKNGTITATYAYDPNGNRTSANGELATYDAQDRLTQRGAAAYAYTPAGDLLSKTANGQTTQYSYDALGNLTAATLPDGTAVQYVIDGEGHRIGRRMNGTLGRGFLHGNALQIVAELDGASTLVSRFVYASARNVPDYMVKGGAVYRLLADTNGSVRLVVNAASGAIVQKIEYGPFGEVVTDTNPGFQPFGFAGGLYDSATGLVRFGFRDYDADAGRWTTKDPILFRGGDPNLYAYVGSDPVNRTDPFGLKADPNLGPNKGPIGGAEGLLDFATAIQLLHLLAGDPLSFEDALRIAIRETAEDRQEREDAEAKEDSERLDRIMADFVRRKRAEFP